MNIFIMNRSINLFTSTSRGAGEKELMSLPAIEESRGQQQ